ncbi:MAG: 1-acyl-sn-glycerol-3-phosphate acyltransferase [Saprospiraceae bacterium]
MFYSFLKVLVRITLKLFFRKIHITGTEHIKDDKAQLIASNHPNGFLEPLIMACFFPKPLHFLVRGDVFDNSFLRPMLISTNQIPIFRFKDGFSKLRENSQTIDESLQVLIDKNNLLIFAEGNTQSIKKLRPLQKGISRIAFQTLEKKPDLDLEILPVGINFTYPDKFDKTVMLRIGAPVQAKDYFDLYSIDKNSGHQKLLDDLYASIKKNVIHIEDENNTSLFEDLVIIERSKSKISYPPVFSTSDDNLIIEKNLAIKIELLSEKQNSSLKQEVFTLKNQMRVSGIKLDDLNKKIMSISRLVVLIIGFLPALYGAITHSIPIAGGYYFTKTKVSQKEFRASILMVSVLILMLLLYIFLIIIFIICHLPIYHLLIIFFSGIWLRYYYTFWNDSTFKSVNIIQNFKLKAIAILDSIN